MLNPVGRAGTGLVTPLLKAGDSDFGVNNWSAIERALKGAGKFNGTVELPAGPIFLENTSLSALNID
jgi:hypothetical protein